MKFLTISDVHIKIEGDLSEKLLLNFFKQAKRLDVQAIYLLGDIFDLLVGGHLLYEVTYPRVFNQIKDLLQSGVRIVQLEGNHDFHFEGLILKLLKRWNIDESMWIYRNNPIVEFVDEQGFLFAHGDEIEIGNRSYKRYRKFIRSSFINFLANKVVSPRVTRAIGQRASRKSREKNSDRYNEKFEEESVRPLFRESATRAASEFSVSTVICGHSHCFDIFEQNGISYYNNGYLPRTQKCFFFNGKKIEALVLDPCE